MAKTKKRTTKKEKSVKGNSPPPLPVLGKDGQTAIGITLPIRWHYPEGLRATFSNNMVLQFDGEEFYLSFFELPPPIAMGDRNQQAKQLQELGAITATCVSRIVISKGRMKQFAKLISEQTARHLDIKQG